MANFNLNHVILGGRLTANPELRQTPQGVMVTSFSVAVNRPYTKGEEAKADFINCVAWRNTAEFIAKHFTKGSSICVIGEINNRSWTDTNGQKRYATDVVVSKANFVDGKGESENSAHTAPSFSSLPDDTPNFEELGDSDDLPF